MQRNKCWLVGGAVAVMMALSLAAFAQAPKKGEKHPGQKRKQAMMLVRIPAATLDAAVGLTSDQKSRITEIQEKYKTDMKALRPAPDTKPDAENRKKRAELTKQANEEIEAILTTEQKEKIKDALKTLEPVRGAGLPTELIAELKLTDDQKKQIGEITQATREKLKSLTPEERRTKRREIVKEATDKIMAVLTPDQKATVEKWFKERRRGRRVKRA